MRSLRPIVSTALGTLLVVATLQLAPTARGASPSPIRINAGGGQYQGNGGVTWSADTGYTGGKTHSTSRKIAGTQDDPIYQSERWGMTAYRFAVAQSGTYHVTLRLAEITYSQVGTR